MIAPKNKDVVTGNHSLAYGAQAARVQVIAAYPITPQTQIVELLSELCANKKLSAEFIKVESEHSALATCIGASAKGARAFTATSSQGLALMHEMLHWTVGSRLPIVMGNVNRALGPPWNVWNEQTDSLAQRDTGWMQIYCSSNQEVLDSVLIAYYVAEKVMLPCMIILDGFILSHTAEIVEFPRQQTADEFLPPYKPDIKLAVNNPLSFGCLTTSDQYFELRYKIQKAMDKAILCFDEAHNLFKEHFNRKYDLIESYKAEDAELLLITAGTLASNTRVAIDRLREEGLSVGSLRLRVFRPFPVEELRRLTGSAAKLCVIDCNLSPGYGGIFAQEIRSTLYGQKNRTDIFGYIAGLGGRMIAISDICDIARDVLIHKPTDKLIYWKGLKGETLHTTR